MNTHESMERNEFKMESEVQNIIEETPVISATEPSDQEVPVIDENNPITDKSIRSLSNLLKQVGEMVGVMEATWKSSQKEFQLTDSHMKSLYQFNEQHKTDMPEYLTAEEKEKWDNFNGLDAMTEDDVENIFGEDHPIIGVMHTQTMDRIKSVSNEFFSWLSALQEYRTVNDAYMKLLEEQEKIKMEQLKSIAEKCEDPVKKENALKAIDGYYSRKYLDFLAEPLPEKDLNRLVSAFTDKNKISYWLQRSQDKFKQLKISTKIILELSQFEKRFLDEKYHKQSNILLLHLMQMIIYCNCGDIKDINRTNVVCMTIALDRFIRNVSEDEERERVLENIIKFEDQFIGKINLTKSEE